MAIDTNIGVIYNENFPVASVDQPSQGFRDNFTAIKRAVENLQNATEATTSLFLVSSTVGAGGVVNVSINYKNNALTLPTGSPSTPVAGMIRYSGGAQQIHDGTGWRTVLATNAVGGVVTPGTSYLKLPTGSNGQRPVTGDEGMMRFNSTLGAVEVFHLGQWETVAKDQALEETNAIAVAAQASSLVSQSLAESAAASVPVSKTGPENTLLVDVGDSTEWGHVQAGGYNARMIQLTSTGGIARGLVGWVTLASSGYALSDFVTGPASVGWGSGPTAGNADWNWQGSKAGAYVAIPTSLVDLTTWLPTLDRSYRVIITINFGHNDTGKSVAVGTLSLADLTDYYVTRYRTALDAIHAARPNAQVLLKIQNRALARPYVGTVPVTAVWNAGGAPGFGTDLAADAVLLTKWDAAQIAAKHKVASEYSFVEVYDFQNEVMGKPTVDVETPTTWPFMADNGHPGALAGAAEADSKMRCLFGDRLAVPRARMELADRLAVINATRPEEIYGPYCEGHPDRYTRALDCYVSTIGTTFIDLNTQTRPGPTESAIGLFNQAIKGRTPIYIQVGTGPDAVTQRFTAYTAAGTGTQPTTTMRLSSLAPSPNAALQAMSNKSLPVCVYFDRETASGDADIDTIAADKSYREVWLGSIANAGNGYMDVSFDRVPGIFSILRWASMKGMLLRIGGTILTTEDLSTWSMSTRTETTGARQIRLLKATDWSARIGARAALLVPVGVPSPGSQNTWVAPLAIGDLTATRVMGVISKAALGVTQYTISSGLAETNAVTGQLYRITASARTAVGAAFTIAANAVNTTITATSIDWQEGDVLEIARTSGAPVVANTVLSARGLQP